MTDFWYEDLVEAVQGDEKKMIMFILDVYTMRNNLCDLKFKRCQDGTVELYQTEAFKAKYDETLLGLKNDNE